jgi:hypothetical protein
MSEHTTQSGEDIWAEFESVLLPEFRDGNIEIGTRLSMNKIDNLGRVKISPRGWALAMIDTSRGNFSKLHNDTGMGGAREFISATIITRPITVARADWLLAGLQDAYSYRMDRRNGRD